MHISVNMINFPTSKMVKIFTPTLCLYLFIEKLKMLAEHRWKDKSETNVNKKESFSTYSPQIKHNQRLLPHFGSSNKIYERVFLLHLCFIFNFIDLVKQSTRQVTCRVEQFACFHDN